MLATLVTEYFRPFWGIWVMGLFLAIVAWAFWPKNKGRFETYGDIPFRDDDDKER